MKSQDKKIQKLSDRLCVSFLLSLSSIVIFSVLIGSLFNDSESSGSNTFPISCTTDEECPNFVSSPCLSSFCNTTTQTCEDFIPMLGECWNNAQCTFFCDLGNCGCGDRCQGVNCTSIDVCEITQCNDFTGNCTSSGFITGCCSETTPCPSISECLIPTCDTLNNNCSYIERENAQCVYDTDCVAPGALCEDCMCTESILMCDLQDQLVLYEQIQTLPTPQEYFMNCGFSTAIQGNLSATICTMYTGGLGGRLQIRVLQDSQWIETATIEDIGTNWVSAQVDIRDNYILVGVPFGFDPISGTNIGTSAVYEYDHTTQNLTLLQQFSFDDDSTFYPLRLGFGFSVSISDRFIIVDGIIASISGAFASVVFAYRMVNPGVWIYQQTLVTPFLPILSGSFVQSVDVEDDILVFGILNSVNNSAIVVNQFNENTELFEPLFNFPEDGNSNGTQYGFRVSTDGNTIIGSTQPNTVEGIPPIVFVFERDGTLIQEFGLPEFSTVVSNGFASSLDVLGDKIAVGCSGCSGSVTGSGAFYLYVREETETIFNFFKKGFPFDNPFVDGDLFGNSVSLSGDFIAVGSPNYEPSGTTVSEPGAVYIIGCQEVQ